MFVFLIPTESVYNATKSGHNPFEDVPTFDKANLFSHYGILYDLRLLALKVVVFLEETLQRLLVKSLIIGQIGDGFRLLL